MGIARGLQKIYAEDIVHKNLRKGNLLIGDEEISVDTKDVYILFIDQVMNLKILSWLKFSLSKKFQGHSVKVLIKFTENCYT